MDHDSPKPSGQTGMTLVETLVALAISSLIVGAVYSVFETHQRIALRQSQTSLMHQELLSAASLIAEELRMCAFSPTGSPAFGFSHRPGTGKPDSGRATTDSAVYCTLDWNADGIVNESGAGSLREHVGFRLNVADDGSPRKVPDNVLRKYDTGAVAWQPFATNIGNLRFTYYDSRGKAIGDPGARTRDIGGVRVEITAIPSPSRLNLGIGNRTATATVWCRNAQTGGAP